MRIALLTITLSLLALVPTVFAQKKQKKPAEPGTVFLVSESKPKHVTCDLEFRDPKDELWPNFFYGKPAGDGKFTFDPKQPKIELTLHCDKMAQKNGDQSRRLLGMLCKDDKHPTIKLRLEKMGEFVPEKRVDARGKTSVVEVSATQGVLEVDGKKVTIQGKSTVRWQHGKDSELPEAVYLDVSFKLKGSDLGLSNVPGEIEARAGVTAFKTLPDNKKKK